MNIYINVFLVDIQLANGNAFFIFKKIGVIDIERGLVSLDYFYGQAGELFSFYRIPKALFQEQRFQNLSTDAKNLYGIQVNALLLLPGIFRQRTAKFFLLETVRGYDIIRMDRKITFEQL